MERAIMMRKKVVSAIVLTICTLGCGSMFYYYNFYGKEQPVGNGQIKYNLSSTEENKLIPMEEKKYYAFIPENTSDQVIIGNQKTGEERTIQIKDKKDLANAVMEVKWINSNQLAIESHINPSLSYFCVYDVENQTFIVEKYGMGFQWIGNDINTLAYYVPTSHFNQQKGMEEIRNKEEQVLYRSKEQVELQKLLLSPNGEKIAVICHDISKEQWELCIIKQDGSALQSYTIDPEPKNMHWISSAELAVDQNNFQISENGIQERNK